MSALPSFRYTVQALLDRKKGRIEDLGTIEAETSMRARWAAEKRWPGKVLIIRPDEPMSTCEKCGSLHYTKHPCGCDDPVLIAAKEFLGRLQKKP